MAQFKKKSKYSFWHSPLVLLFLFFILVLFSYNMIGLVQKERETNRNKVSELNKIDELKKRKDTLSKEIDKLNTEEGIEESVRDKFQVVKPGEKMVIIVDESVNQQSLPEENKDHSFWGYIKRLFSR